MSSQQAPALMRKGVLLVSGSAFVWSIDGAIWRFLRVHDSWTVVFWRSTFEALFPLFDSMYFVVSPFDFGLLILFGAVNLGTGLAMFSSGARLIPRCHGSPDWHARTGFCTYLGVADPQ